MKRILSVITAAAALLSLTACVKAPEETVNTRPKETKEAVTYEPYKGVSGDYSGAKFASIADLTASSPDDSDGYYKNIEAYRSCGDGLTAFYDKLNQKVLEGGDAGAVSPVNVYMALSLLAECAEGSSRAEILDVLGVKSIEELREQSKLVWFYNNRDDKLGKSMLANSVWLSSGLPVKEACAEHLKKDHYASAFAGDFGDEKYINALKQWLSDMTNGLLDNSINGLVIPPDTAITLASTLYYKTKWYTAYKETEEGKFDGEPCVFNKKVNDNQIYKGKGFTAYAERLSDNNRMWFFLPDKNKTVDDVLKTGVISYINNDPFGIEYEVTVRMPDFDISLDGSIKDALRDIGISECMTEKADFSALTDDSLFLSDVIHACRVKADKDGVEGAAFTVMTLAGSAPFELMKLKYDFTLDRPFVFVIENGGTPLFVGCVNDVN